MTERGIRHVTCPLEWGTIAPSQDSARKLRYEALAKACVFHGVDTLVTAHHEDDNIETFAMRLGRASGIDGLAGIRASSTTHQFVPSLMNERGQFIPASVVPLTLLRPFLSFPKSRLRATLQACGWLWAEDPTNATDKYQRNRVRAQLQLHDPCSDALRADVLRYMASCAADRDTMHIKVSQIIAGSVTFSELFGFATVSLAALRPHPTPLVVRALSSVVRTISGNEHPVPLNQTAMLESILSTTSVGSPTKHSIHGCVIWRTRKDIFVVRQPPPRQHALAVSCAVPKGSVGGVWWDSRFLVRVRSNPAWAESTSQSGSSRLFTIRHMTLTETQRPFSPKIALHTIPVVDCEHTRGACVPHFGEYCCDCLVCDVKWAQATF